MRDISTRVIHATRVILLFTLIFVFAISPIRVSAQVGDEEEFKPIQVITGSSEGNYTLFYLVKSLKAGDTLYAYMEATSANLDPFLALSEISIDPVEALKSFSEDVQAVIDQGEDPFAAMPELASQYLLAWDDDSGEGRSAAMRYLVPEDGDYRLWVSDGPATDTFGNFRLLIGINTPEVLDNKGTPTGDTIAVLDRETTREHVGVQEYSGVITPARPATNILLQKLEDGDEISVFVEAISGDLKPAITLMDYSNKILRSGNLTGKQTQASLVYTIDEGKTENYSLEITGCCQDSPTTGDYRLLVGLNAPEVLSGQGEEIGIQVLDLPKEVKIGIKLQQITDVAQISENYSVVATLRMEWTDPRLAFNPDECQCRFKSFPGKAFDDFIELAKDEWPEFTLFNQQGNRWNSKPDRVDGFKRACYLSGAFLHHLASPRF